MDINRFLRAASLAAAALTMATIGSASSASAQSVLQPTGATITPSVLKV